MSNIFDIVSWIKYELTDKSKTLHLQISERRLVQNEIPFRCYQSWVDLSYVHGGNAIRKKLKHFKLSKN